ncbi:hypothetical protein, partial [Flavonifractor plautii]|uniref:hypothetical protein n=1 Tax=Flavonifractor plautii TaxID=292800 RepID=UPI001A9AF815
QDTIFTLFRATGIGGDWNPTFSLRSRPFVLCLQVSGRCIERQKYCCKYREKAQSSLVFEMRSIILRCPIGNNLYHALDDRAWSCL